MRATCFALVALLTASSAFAAPPAPIEVEQDAPAPKRPAKHIVVKDLTRIEGHVPRPVQVVIPRDGAVRGALDASGDQLMDALQRR